MSQSVNWPARLAVCLAALAVVVVVLLGPAYRMGWLDLGPIFRKAFPAVVYAGGLAALLATVGLIYAARIKRGALTALLALLLAAGAMAVPLSMRHTARQVPPIHDLSTDLIDPPSFVAIVPLRAAASNPPDYGGPQIAAQQRSAYPDLQTIRIRTPAAEVFAAAGQIVQDLGWEVHAMEAADGRIEATDTTSWFGFKDDIVIRVVGMPAVTAVDVRSKSRVGVSDLGVNAARIRQFRDLLKGRLLEL